MSFWRAVAGALLGLFQFCLLYIVADMFQNHFKENKRNFESFAHL